MCKKLQHLGDFVCKTPYLGFAPGPTKGLPSPEPPDWSVFILGLSGGISFPKNKTTPKNSTRPENQRHEFMAG